MRIIHPSAFLSLEPRYLVGLFFVPLAASSGSRPWDEAVDIASASACRYIVLGALGIWSFGSTPSSAPS